jgi:DNA-binding NtrC family response regulator
MNVLVRAKSLPFRLVSDMPPKIKTMLVMARGRHQPLLDALESCGIEVLWVCDCNEVREMLATQPVQVVVTDTTLPDGDWRRVLEIVEQGSRRVEVVVCSRLNDPELWLDVLEQGGYDLLAEPFEHEEVRRILEAAAGRSLMRSAQWANHKRNAARAAVA